MSCIKNSVVKLTQKGIDRFTDAALAGLTGPGWYFWEGMWYNFYGPYLTKKEAEQAQNEYVKEYSNNSDDHLERAWDCVCDQPFYRCTCGAAAEQERREG